MSTENSTGRIVVGVDGSAASAEALRWAVQQARLTGAQVQAVTAWQLPTSYAWGPIVDDVDWADGARQAQDAMIKDTLDDDDAAGVQRTVLEGHPAYVLLEAAKGADLLVMGSRGHGGFAGMVLGSVSQHVIAHAPVPVLVTRVHTAD